MTDTVGFIRRLPTQLVEGFAATLEETLSAELVLHVAERPLPTSGSGSRSRRSRRCWSEIGAGELPVVLVLNKIDAVDPLGRRRLRNRFPDAIQVSARSGEGLDELKRADRRAVRGALRAGTAARPAHGRPFPGRALRSGRADRAAARTCRKGSCWSPGSLGRCGRGSPAISSPTPASPSPATRRDRASRRPRLRPEAQLARRGVSRGMPASTWRP